MFIDIHVHNEYFEKDTIIVRNVFPEEINEFNLSKNIFYSSGIHPWYILNSNIDENLNKIKKLISKNNFIAVGETGLDKNINVLFELQKKYF